ncbi:MULTISPECIES: trypsin-like peptidase domain-containing protein [Halobacterium]|uniref:S1C family serine protease n=1 Tax=Halobacterium TaxID=2239 RepID=UPI001962AC22|nr:MULTISPECIES: trypsin-like peptidase domain-containing protein [Halobacterium]MDL0123359.1 trypsin-like peptidase domain-containing protein [Halobacterium salinarum]QRY24974.1 trypsin-like peptidase domain-containing protein [Halobacterium sp. BOL4-2]
MPSRRDVLRLGAGVLAAGTAGCTDTAPNRVAAAETAATTTRETTTDSRSESPYTAVYRDVIDSVVMIRTQSGQGTGWLYNDTTLVTNAHVVGRSETVNVRFNDGTWETGRVRGTDPNSDLAAVTVTDTPAAATPLALRTASPVAGTEVVAIGNPFALNGTVTTGIISGTNRAIPAPTGYRIPDAVQTDAAVNPGNSGGPLVSLDGDVVAVVNSGGGDNIAFGISAALTDRVVPSLIDTGDYEHAYLGVSFTPVTPTVADANGLTESRGLLVMSVDPSGPSAGRLVGSDATTIVDGGAVRVGGDIVLAVNGTRVHTLENVLSLLALHTSPGDTVSVRLLRDGDRRTVDVELGARPSG